MDPPRPRYSIPPPTLPHFLRLHPQPSPPPNLLRLFALWPLPASPATFGHQFYFPTLSMSRRLPSDTYTTMNRGNKFLDDPTRVRLIAVLHPEDLGLGTSSSGARSYGGGTESPLGIRKRDASDSHERDTKSVRRRIDNFERISSIGRAVTSFVKPSLSFPVFAIRDCVLTISSRQGFKTFIARSTPCFAAHYTTFFFVHSTTCSIGFAAPFPVHF
ncbi:hypothetical protein OF83DRAFT_1176087 [Amylostereum chailletii]|nr:hypothetical protein OF83DRAFT_1176087 [Amylostereum chailletii]